MTATIDNLRLVGMPGSNRVMAGELSRLARRAHDDLRLTEPKKQGLGSIVHRFDPRLALVAVEYHRTSARVLRDLYQSRATRLEPLYRELVEAVRADARTWCWDGARISVHAFGVQEFAAGERQIVGTVKNALVDGMAARGIGLSVDPDRPDMRLHARLYDGALVVSLDLAGRPMHQRGYRLVSGTAPMREDLAAILVMLARHDSRREALVDPLAGTGTIAIEAACMARGRRVWMSGRAPDASAWPDFAQIASTRPPPLFSDTRPIAFAADVDGTALTAMERNLATAGVTGETEIFGGDFRDTDPGDLRRRAEERGASGGLILSNPPYGERLGGRGEDLAHLYRDLGRWCRELRGWRAGFFVANDGFEAAFGGRPRVKKPLRNGPLKGYFHLYDL